MTFQKALAVVLQFEGGYSNHQQDAGGETMYGITEATARKSGYSGPMKALPMKIAEAIYRVRYWNACRCDELPAALRLPVFDAAVNCGKGQAIRWLQRAVLVADDGILGPVTMAAVHRCDPAIVAALIHGQRLDFYTRLSTWRTFGTGWTRRVAKLLRTR